jgi:hypothetical protein
MTIVRRTDAQGILFDGCFAAALRCAHLRIVAAAGLCVVSACAGPFRGARFSEGGQTPSSAAVVHIYHIANYPTAVDTGAYNSVIANNWFTAFLTERVYVDGNSKGVLTYADHHFWFGRVRRCEYVSVTLPPGSHEFRADYDPPFHDSSGPIAATATRIDLEAGQTYWVRIYSQQDTNTTLWHSLTGFRKLGHTVGVVDRDTGLPNIADCTLSRTP